MTSINNWSPHGVAFWLGNGEFLAQEAGSRVVHSVLSVKKMLISAEPHFLSI